MIRLAFVFLLIAAPAAAADMTFFMKNGMPYGVAVELYSRNRFHRWPGGDEVYLLERGEKKSATVQCEAGERICWGAWRNGDDGTAFGVGPDDTRDCPSCCRICVEKTTSTVAVE